MKVTREDLKRLSPGELRQFVDTMGLLVQEREAGKVPWRCSRKDCDGRAHPGANGPHARASQLPHPGDWWDIWLLLAGRGFGKTRTGAEWCIEQARTLGPESRGAIIGPTSGDTRLTLVQGESGILACAPATFMPTYNPSIRQLTYPNGAIQTLYSADEPDRLRGPQHHYFWADELAAWRYLQYAWDMLQMGLRLGEHPRGCVTTTPRPLPLIKEMLKDERVHTTRGSTYDNLHNLASTFQRAVISRYEGTTLGRQELDAEVLEDLPGALVARKHIDAARITEKDLPELVSIVVGLDPAGTSKGDETGLVVAGYGTNKHHYILADASKKRTPDETARAAYALREQFGASAVVVEDNGGKDWIGEVLKRVWRDLHGDGAGPAPVIRVNASQGKKLRAQPVAMLYEQGRVHHVGVFPELEDQLTTWIPEEDPNSPDHLDAMVHAVAHHMKRDAGQITLATPYGVPRSVTRVHPMLASRDRAAQRRKAG